MVLTIFKALPTQLSDSMTTREVFVVDSKKFPLHMGLNM